MPLRPVTRGATRPRTGGVRAFAGLQKRYRPAHEGGYRSNTFSIRTRRPSIVSYHSCCFRACFMLLMRCRIRVPVTVSISTSLDTHIIPVDE